MINKNDGFDMFVASENVARRCMHSEAFKFAVDNRTIVDLEGVPSGSIFTLLEPLSATFGTLEVRQNLCGLHRVFHC